MNLIEELRTDHARIREALGALAPGTAAPGALGALAGEISEQFRLEDDLLYGAFERRLPGHGVPLDTLRAEHRELGRLLDKLAEEQRLPWPVVSRLTHDVREHLREEESVLFTFAERLLDADLLHSLGAEYRSALERTPGRTEIGPESRVADLAREIPATIRVFQRLGIDFCCGGKLPLAEACANRGIPVDAVVAELRQAANTEHSGAEADWNSRPPVEIVGHVLARYHAGLREELERLVAMSRRAAERHGATHPELVEVRDLVARLATEMRTHLEREERSIFPALLRGETLELEAELASAESEHAEVGELLARLRRATNEFRPPAEACNTWRGLFHGLEELERDTHVHVHLENNVLFPKAVTRSCSL